MQTASVVGLAIAPAVRICSTAFSNPEDAHIDGDQVTRPIRGGHPRATGDAQLPQESLPERYQYIEPISAGGMGSVHAVRDLGLLRVAAMKVLWTQAEASYQGTLVRFERVWQWPKPVQQPHPPILMGGDGPNTLRRVVAYADGWMPVASRGAVPGQVVRGRAATHRK